MKYEQLEQKLETVETFETVTEAFPQKSLKKRDAQQNYKRFLQFLPYPVIVQDAKQIVTYLNPAFTKTFGWTSKDLKGNHEAKCIPPALKDEINKKIKALPDQKKTLQFNTQRITKQGKVRDVVIRIGVDKDKNNNPGEMIIVLKDTTMEIRNKRNRDAMSRISLALPEYPDLKKLLFYVNTEIKNLLGVEGANVILLDKAQKQFYFFSTAHDNPDTKARIAKTRFAMDELLSGQVVKTGIPMIVNNFPDTEHKYNYRDQKVGYTIKNVLLVPLKTQDSTIGILAADNKKNGDFDNTDLDTLNTIAATIALSIENARVSRELRKAYVELKSLNKAKDKMISHLSHELKTPVAILLSSFKILSKRVSGIEKNKWQPTMERIKRNLNRIVGIEDEVYDIVENKEIFHSKVFSLILEQCQDVFESLIAEETGEKGVIAKVRQKIDDIFNFKAPAFENIMLNQFVEERIAKIKHAMAHRNIRIDTDIQPVPLIKIPVEPLRKTVDGLIKNAVENTPDNGSIKIFVNKKDGTIEFKVQDRGIGLTKDAKKRIFEGFFTAQDTMEYSSKRAFDFNAGGKGADLLRMKIFSEKYNFKISMISKRCQHLLQNRDRCPGSMHECQNTKESECGGKTVVTCLFPLQEIAP